MNREHKWSVWLCCLMLSGLGCGPADNGEPVEEAGVPEFPVEVTAADFTGTSYPDHQGELGQPASLQGPVWLIGIDGATWDLIEPLVEQGELPNFAALLENGAHGILRSEEPTISPALWATIATGMPRFEHGIGNFIVKLPGSYRTLEAGPRDRRSPAIWELVGAAGGSSAVISWFGSFPAEEIEGIYISKGFDPENLHPQQVYPASFGALLSERAQVRMRRWDLEQIAKTETLRRSLLGDARTLAALRVVAKIARPDLLAVYFSGIDVAQHVTWRHMDPASQQFSQDGPPQPELAGVIPAYYRFIDNTLGEIRELAPQNTTLMILSDHGAGPMQPVEAFHLQLEVLLEQLGLMSGEQDGVAFAISELYRFDKRIWLNLRGVEARGTVQLEEAGAQAHAIEARLAALRTESDEPLFNSIAAHTDHPDWRPGDPALTVRFSGAALLAESVEDAGRTIAFAPVRLRHTDVSGAHKLPGILLLQGPGIRPGPLAEPCTLYQIAPTLLYLLGLPQDRRMLRYSPAAGAVIEAALDPALLESYPITMLAEYPETDRTHLLRPRAGADEEKLDPAFEESLEKLKSLGYLR